MEQQVLFWIFVVIFSATAIITLLGITNLIQIKANFLNALFTALILEVVAAIIVVFQSFNFNDEGQSLNLNDLIKEANLAGQLQPRQTPEAFIIAKLKESEKLAILNEQLEFAQKQADSLMVVLENCEGQTGSIREDLNKYERSFYGKVTRLREMITKYGGVINIAFQEQDKEDVFKLLIGIFTDLGKVTNQTPIYEDNAQSKVNYTTLKNMYRFFRQEHGRPVEDKNYIYITEFDTVLMIQEYLKLIAPVEN